jgi:membrane protein YdbS with pleckstrin-like domain
VTEPDYAELDPRYIPQQRFTGRLRVLAIAAASLVVLMVLLQAGDGGAWRGPVLVAIWMIAVALVVWHAEAWPARAFAHTRYRLSADGLQIARGVLWRTVTHVPRSRVQHTDVSQGPIERRYGLGTLIVYTAGTDHARVALPGLAWETALALRDELRLDRSDDHV